MTTYGKIQPFEGDGSDWPAYMEVVEEVFEANAITEESKKKSIFLATCGMKCYSTLRKLVMPDRPRDKTLTELLKLLSDYYAPVPSEIVMRFKFHNRYRLQGESVMSYLSELRDITNYCNYGSVLNDMLRDQLVCGINNDELQQRLFAEPKLTYGKAVDISLAWETAARDVASVQGDISKNRNPDELKGEINKLRINKDDLSEEINKLSINNRNNGRSKEGNIGATKCFRCGYRHMAKDCKLRDARCFRCRKIGHVARVCKSEIEDDSQVPRTRREGMNAISGLEEDEVYPMQTLIEGVGIPPVRIALQVQGEQVTMEVDSGAGLSVVNDKFFDYLWGKDNSITLERSNVKLRGYFGTLTKVKGRIMVTVVYRGKTYVLPLYIAPGDGPPIIGRDWLLKMEIIPQLFELHVLGSGETFDMVLRKYSQVFSENLGTMKNVKAKISVPPGSKPRFYKSRPVPFAMQEKIETEIDRLVLEGVLMPIRYSDWAAPIVAVLKDDGSVRLTGDFKITVNTVSNLEQYPVPRIDELFAKLSGGSKFTKIDLRDAYFQMELEDASQEYVTINTTKGLFRYTRLPQGLASAPAIFIRAMDGLLGNMKQVATFFDDILITGRDDREHLANLEEVLKRLQEAGLTLKKSKCQFLKEEIVYLGYKLDRRGLQPTHEKVQAIKKAPEPKNIKELQAYLGLLNHYRRFMPNLADVLTPLHKLLQKEAKWSWKEAEKKAFEGSKELLTSEDLLVFFDPNKPIVVSCDASPYGLGAVLSHRFPSGEERPVGFISRSLTKAECNYSQLDKEALALTFAVVKFHQYLFGFKFELQTDHKPLLGLFKKEKPLPTLSSPRIIRWAIILAAYDFELVYRPGKNNCNADALSRLPLAVGPIRVPRPAEVFMLEKEYPNLLSPLAIAKYTSRDLILSVVRAGLWSGEILPDDDPEIRPYSQRALELSIQDDCILWGSRVIIPLQLRPQVLDLLHEGHPGMVKMKSIARSHVWWPNLDSDIERRVRDCSTCQRFARSPPPVPMRPWPCPGKPWSRLHIDHAGPFRGRLYLIVVDAFSKWLEVMIVPSTASRATIDCLRTIFASHGLPDLIVSDNGPGFTSIEFGKFLKENGIRFLPIPPYHPASNGAAERVVQSVKDKLKKLKRVDGDAVALARFLLHYRSQVHCSTGASPAELLYNRKLKTLLDCIHPNGLTRRSQGQLAAKVNYDRKSKGKEFKVGDYVMARNFREGTPWIPGRVVGSQGPQIVMVQVKQGIWRRHLDQVKIGPQMKIEMSESGEREKEYTLSRPRELVPTYPPREVDPGPQEGVGPKGNGDGSAGTREFGDRIEVPQSQTPGKRVVDTPGMDLRRSGRTIRKPDKLDL